MHLTLGFRPTRYLWLLVGLTAALPAAESAPANREPYELPKMEVKSSMVCSFGIGISVALDRTNLTITHLFVNDVAPGSDADSLGLVRGDEILAINGRKVSDLKGGAKAGSELFALLVNQPPGTKINLDVAVRTLRKVSLSAAQF